MGVIDGHDVGALRDAIGDALGAQRPVVVHIHTVKGKGFTPAEEGGLEGMEKWHAAKPNSIVNRMPAESKPAPVRETRLAGGDREARVSPRPPRRPSTRRCSPTLWSTKPGGDRR